MFEILSLKFDEDGTCFGNRELFGVLFELLIGVWEGDRFRLTASRYSLLPTLSFRLEIVDAALGGFCFWLSVAKLIWDCLFELLIGVGEGDRFRLTASRYEDSDDLH